jgi:hypothetical protein
VVSHHSGGLEAGPRPHQNSKSMASKRGTSTTSAPSTAICAYYPEYYQCYRGLVPVLRTRGCSSLARCQLNLRPLFPSSNTEHGCSHFRSSIGLTDTSHKHAPQPIETVILASTRSSSTFRLLCSVSKTPQVSYPASASVHQILKSLPAQSRRPIRTAPRRFHSQPICRFTKTRMMSDTGVHNLNRFVFLHVFDVLDSDRS